MQRGMEPYGQVGQMVLHIIVPFLPPTANHIYENNRGGGRRLSTEAREFKNRFASEVVPRYLIQLNQFIQTNSSGLFRVGYVFYFNKDELINRGFEKGKAATRYKKMDVENRLKLVADSLAATLGIDDCNFFGIACDKRNCELVGGTPQMHIFLTPASPSEFGL